MKLPMLISKKEGQKICVEDYKVGWLIKDNIGGLWMIFGSCRDLDAALSVARDMIKESGERDIYLSKVPLNKQLTLEQISDLEKITLN